MQNLKMEKKELIVYGDDAKEWLDFALGNMRERMGFSFPKVIQEWLFEFVAEVGYVLTTNPRNTLWCWDNAYTNRMWGKIEEREWSKKEAEKLYEEGNLMFYDETSGYYVESL